MDSKIKILLQLVVIPNLRSLASYLALRDADNMGNEDRLSRTLLFAASELEAYLAEDQQAPVPATSR